MSAHPDEMPEPKVKPKKQQCDCNDELHQGRCENNAVPGNSGFCGPCLFGCLP